jgi:TetR/AcrR family transcriptional regulator, transcriptional repressor of bet genes
MADSTRTRGVGAEHDARRAEIADALLKLVGERGLDGLSLRDVAAEAGVSVGRVQHYFRTKDQALHAAFERATGLGEDLVRRRIAQTGDSSPRTVLRAIATELLPVDDRHRQALQIGTAFATRALVEDHFAARLRSGYGRLHDLLVLLLSHARHAGEAPPDLNPGHEAHLLLGLFEGLSAHTLVGHHSVDTALSVLDSHLDRIFAGNADRQA